MKGKVGDIYTYRIFGNAYGAVQVVRKGLPHPGSPNDILLVPFKLASDKPATLDDLTNTAFDADGACWSDHLVPWWASLVGTEAPRDFPWRSSRSGWAAPCFFPPFLRRLRGSTDARDKSDVTVKLGDQDAVVRRDLTRLNIGALMPSDATPVTWASLDQLPDLVEVTYRGADRGFLAWLKTRSRIRHVNWYAPQSDCIDFSAHGISDLSIYDIDRPFVLRLPMLRTSISGKNILRSSQRDRFLGIERVLLRGATGSVTVESDALLEPFRLILGRPTFRGVPRGMEGVRCLDLRGISEVDLAELCSLTQLAELTIRKAKLTNIAALQKLSELREISGIDLYHFDAEAFPAPPANAALYQVSLDGLRADDAAILRRRLKGVAEVAFRRVRSAAWLAANADNPFAEWGDTDAKAAREAVKLWKKALNAARKAGPKPSEADAREILLHLIEGLNRLERAIDTVMREEACEAGLRLMREHLGGVMDDDATAAFIDSNRDF